ncbi:conserved protein of unknown function [Tenacibaculum sp. 190130A14a]|uniref:Uncharacterized protein n=1 Tax=Tenacibaculum polynesiense TaxID=3137857 RepID=A0ABM9P7J3_9FLAO
MKIIELKNFIKTGDFDKIKVGTSTKQDVIDLMGNDFDFGDFGETQIIKFGWYEFFYWTESEIVFAIQNDHLQFDCSNHNEMIEYQNENIKIDNWFLQTNKNIKFSEVIQILKSEKIQYELDKQNFDGALEYLKLQNGLTMDFDNELTTWIYNESADEWDMKNELIKNQQDYILNGIRLFKY